MNQLYAIDFGYSRDKFKLIVEKLLSKGFVFGSARLKTFESICSVFPNTWAGYPHIIIGEIRDTDCGCSMILHGGFNLSGIFITADEFIQNVLPNWPTTICREF